MTITTTQFVYLVTSGNIEEHGVHSAHLSLAVALKEAESRARKERGGYRRRDPDPGCEYEVALWAHAEGAILGYVSVERFELRDIGEWQATA